MKIFLCRIGLCGLLGVGFAASTWAHEGSAQDSPTTSEAASSSRESFGAYLVRIEDHPTAFLINKGLRNVAPMTQRPTLALFALKLLHPTDVGLPDHDESAKVFEIEGKVATAMTTKLDAVYAGNMVSRGRMTSFFYIANADTLQKVIGDVMAAYPDYTFKAVSQPDPEWKLFRDFLSAVAEQEDQHQQPPVRP